jgi:hypothetical protein
MHFPPRCSPSAAQNFDVFRDEKSALFRYASDGKSTNRLLIRIRFNVSDWSHITIEELYTPDQVEEICPFEAKSV